jgi:hypothetical protein
VTQESNNWIANIAPAPPTVHAEVVTDVADAFLFVTLPNEVVGAVFLR